MPEFTHFTEFAYFTFYAFPSDDLNFKKGSGCISYKKLELSPRVKEWVDLNIFAFVICGYFSMVLHNRAGGVNRFLRAGRQHDAVLVSP